MSTTIHVKLLSTEMLLALLAAGVEPALRALLLAEKRRRRV